MAEQRDGISVRALLYILLAAGVIVLVAALWVGWTTFQVNHTTERVLNLYEPAAQDISQLSVANSDMQRGVSEYALDPSQESLTVYVSGERRSSLALDSLQSELGSDPDLAPYVRGVSESRQRWVDEVGAPAIAAVRAQQDATAKKLITGARGHRLSEDLDEQTARLDQAVEDERSVASSEVSQFGARLAVAVRVAIGVVVLAIGVGVWILVWLVLKPIDHLRRQIRTIADGRHYHQPISRPRRPKEVAYLASDAEIMRRRLVNEIDEARSAREALEDTAPVVAAFRRELESEAPVVAGLDVYGRVLPAEGVLAGDWWDCIVCPDGSVALMVTDISGHGAASGIAAVRLKHLLVDSLRSGADPVSAVTTAADMFETDESRFATTAVVTVDVTTGQLLWVNAGHHPPIIVNPHGTVRELKPTGPLLSWIGGPWQLGEQHLAEDEVLFCFSDGLVESHDSSGEELESRGLISMLSEETQRGSSMADTVESVLAAARDRAKDWDRDDVTLVAMRRTPSQS